MEDFENTISAHIRYPKCSLCSKSAKVKGRENLLLQETDLYQNLKRYLDFQTIYLPLKAVGQDVRSDIYQTLAV